MAVITFLAILCLPGRAGVHRITNMSAETKDLKSDLTSDYYEKMSKLTAHTLAAFLLLLRYITNEKTLLLIFEMVGVR